MKVCSFTCGVALLACVGNVNAAVFREPRETVPGDPDNGECYYVERSGGGTSPGTTSINGTIFYLGTSESSVTYKYGNEDHTYAVVTIGCIDNCSELSCDEATGNCTQVPCADATLGCNMSVAGLGNCLSVADDKLSMDCSNLGDLFNPPVQTIEAYDYSGDFPFFVVSSNETMCAEFKPLGGQNDTTQPAPDAEGVSTPDPDAPSTASEESGPEPLEADSGSPTFSIRLGVVAACLIARLQLF